MEQKSKNLVKIAFTGPESCGKSTLAMWTSHYFKLPLCEEFARAYLSNKKGYGQEDLDMIANGQWKNWNDKGNSFIADTDMTVLKIWSEYRFQALSPLLDKYYNEQCFDHYFLCFPDIPWEEDPLRENQHDRLELFHMYELALREKKRTFSVLSGNLTNRQKKIRSVMKNLLIN